jgi:hypothetical protein
MTPTKKGVAPSNSSAYMESTGKTRNKPKNRRNKIVDNGKTFLNIRYLLKYLGKIIKQFTFKKSGFSKQHLKEGKKIETCFSNIE